MSDEELKRAYEAGALAYHRNNEGARMITPDEWLERRRQGLCVQCGDDLVTNEDDLCEDCEEVWV